MYGSADSQDYYLLDLASSLHLTCVSVEYRLTPEHPYPASQNDSVDAALYAFSAEGVATLGGPLRLLAGESAGAYLAVWTVISLRDDFNVDVKSKIAGLLCSYGLYDVSGTPSLLNHTRNVIVSRKNLLNMFDAAFPKDL